jgi:prepilin-type N-terminal cleavage/methylation domain-containing protein
MNIANYSIKLSVLRVYNGRSDMKTMKQGFTLVEIMIVVAIIGLLAAIAIPSFMKARTQSQQNACINNLRQIEGAKEQWALEKRKAQGVTAVTAEVMEYIKNPSSSTNCPSGGTVTYGVIGTNCTCSVTTPLIHKLSD